MARISVVATPIGNMEDITFRAIRVLGEADAILCEDTRVTSKLLARYELHTPLISYHTHSGVAKYDRVYALLDTDANLALVSDAGTPTISDPGARLVRAVRERYGDSVPVEAVPGPSAVIAALAIAGVSADTFTFLGFPPHKKGRETFFVQLAQFSHTVVFYESPHRLMKALASLVPVCAHNRSVTVVRELTKIHESVVYGTAEEVLAHFQERPDTVRGECVIIVAPVAACVA